MTNIDLAILFKKIQTGLLNVISQWQVENLTNTNDRLSELYNKNMYKIMSISLEPDATFNKMKLNIYNILKIDIKHLIDFEFVF